MKLATALPLATLCVAGFLFVESTGATIDEERLLVQEVENIANTASELLLHSNDFHYSPHSNKRHIRSMSEDIQKQFKDFSDRVGKLPEQIGGQIKKFFEERGISAERIQSILKAIADAVEKLVDEVRKAISSDKSPAAAAT